MLAEMMLVIASALPGLAFTQLITQFTMCSFLLSVVQERVGTRHGAKVPRCFSLLDHFGYPNISRSSAATRLTHPARNGAYLLLAPRASPA